MSNFPKTLLLLLAVSLGAGQAAAQAQELPECEYADSPAPGAAYDDWNITLVDTALRLSADYVPPDLVPLTEAGFPDERYVRRLLIDDLAELRRAAEQAGIQLAVQSAYRSYAYQEDTFAYWVELEGHEAALASSARPGHSEHQLGTVIDFRSAGGPAAWDLEDWAETPEGAWMRDNAWQYGFVMSYPAGKREVTCYVYEPWHYRYVGRDVARAVKESGLTLREWLFEQHYG